MKHFFIVTAFLSLSLVSFAQVQTQTDDKKTDFLTPGGKAEIKFENLSHSFGNVIEGQIATHEFVFTNTGTEPLTLTNVRASCGCTTPKWPRETIEPGKTAVIRAEYNSAGRPGTFSKNIFVTSNAGEATLTISGNVVKEPEKPLSPIIIK
jgi:hypothetical protein